MIGCSNDSHDGSGICFSVCQLASWMPRTLINSDNWSETMWIRGDVYLKRRLIKVKSVITLSTAIWDWTRINCKRRLVNQPVMYSWLAPHQTLYWWCRCRWVNVKVVSFRFACIVKTPTDCLCTNLSALKNIS
jgi:hypothetical protein